MKLLSVIQFCKQANTTPRTLQYYDNIGVFKPLSKDEKGTRYYIKSQIINFNIIQTLTSCNISLSEIKTQLNYYNNSFTRLYSKYKVKISTFQSEIASNIKKIEAYYSLNSASSRLISKFNQSTANFPEQYTLKVTSNLEQIPTLIKALSSQFNYFPRNPTIFIHINIQEYNASQQFTIGIKNESRLAPKALNSGLIQVNEATIITNSKTQLLKESLVGNKLSFWKSKLEEKFTNLTLVIHRNHDSSNHLSIIHAY